MKSRALISIVVPVFNEEENLPRFYEEMTKSVEGADFDIDIIFVNDGSKDRSMEVLRGLHASDSRVKVLNLSRNFGSYGAIEAGLSFARGDAIMCISADLQDPPEIINKFVPLWRSGHEIVWGTRAGRDDPFFKALYARIFYWFVRKAAFSDFPEDGMDIGLFDRVVVDHYLQIGDRNSIPFFTIYSLGFRQARVPYRRGERYKGVSGWPFWKRVKCAIDIAVNFSYLPIRFITGAGTVCATFAFLYGLIIIGLKLFSQATVSGWSSLAVLILFIGGIQMVFMGIIAEYLWRTNDRVKNRPVYLVMDVLDASSKP